MTGSGLLRKYSISRYAIIAGAVLTLLVTISAIWNISNLTKQAIYLATQEARADWNKDQALRRWATRHGGVYVQPDERTPPNPYLKHLPYRDVETTDGMKLTLMNPAYMMSQMTREFESLYGIKGKITGQVLLNPKNKADPWEMQALKRFDTGEKEVLAQTSIGGQPYVRLMRPMVMKEGCVLCHGHLGFKVGDIRGGVSISVPLTPYFGAAEESETTILASHGFVWLMGMFVIGFVSFRGQRRAEERRQTDDELLLSQARLEEVFAIAPEAIITIDANMNITMFNQGAERIFGHVSADIIGQSMEILIPERLRHNHHRKVEEFDKSQDAYRFMNQRDEIVGVRKNGDEFPASASVSKLETDGEKMFTVILHDMSLRREADADRQLLEEQVRRSQKMEAIGQLTGGVAHDFNNILGIIQGNLELLEDIVEGDDKATERVRKALKGVNRGADITRKLLSFSRKKAQISTLVSINDFIENIKDLIVKSLTVTIQVDTHLADDLWPVAIDPGDLEDALLNLSLNARDAMPDGGTLIIETANKVLDTDYVARNPMGHAGEFVMISVSDTGTGMSDDVIDKVLDPFFTTKEKGKGTGLGLSMVYGFVDRSGGHMKIYSEEGKGTTFRLYLPRSVEGQQIDVAAPDLSLNMPTGQETILIVDDEEALREIAVTQLELLGYTAITAENGEMALQFIHDGHDIDLLFSDVVMPGKLDGYQLAMAAHAVKPSLRILLASGFTKAMAGASGNENKFVVRLNEKMLSKPYNKFEMAAAIRQVLDSDD